MIDHERRFRGHGTIPVPWREDRGRRVRPATRRCRQRRAFATEEVQFEVFKRHVGGVLERRYDLSRIRVQRNFARELDQTPRVRVFNDDVHRYQAPERVCVLRRQIHRAFQFVFEQWRLDLHRPDLRPVRTEVGPRRKRASQFRRESVPLHARFVFGVQFFLALVADLIARAPERARCQRCRFRGTRFKAIATRRVDRHAFGQRHRGVPERGLRQAVGVECGGLWDVDTNRQPRGRAGVAAVRRDADFRRELELRAARQRHGRACVVVRDRARLRPLARFFPRVDRDRRAQGAVAARRHRQERFAANQFLFV